MKGFLSFLSVIAALVAACFLTDESVGFFRKNRRKYVSIREDRTK